MKKQILFCLGLPLLLVNFLSFSMESNQNQERQLVIFNQSQGFPVSQRQQNVTGPIISSINNPQAGSSSPQINDFTTHNHQTGSLPDTSALLSDEEAQRFMGSVPTSKARIIINMIMKRCFKNSPHKGSLIISFIGENGTGKTSLIKAIIVTLQRPFAFIPAQEIMDQDQHSVLQHIKNTIRPFLERDMPCVIALDDIDKFYSPHEIYTEKLKPDQLLSYYLDEAKAKDKNRQKPHFIILSSANQQKNLSDMFCARSQIVEIGKPDYSSRFKILTDLIKDASISYEHISIEDLAKRTESLSIKNLSDLIDLSVLLNDTKDIPYYYLSKTCIEQMLKELLPEKEIKREEEEEEEESLSVKNVGKQYQDRTSSVILSTVGNIIKFVITKATQDWLLSLIQRKIMPK